MDPAETVKEIRRTTPLPPKTRAEKGVWVDYAKAAKILVTEDHWTVSDAVRRVIETHKLHPEDAAFKGIRAAYYALK
jgi:hypothetical protein